MPSMRILNRKGEEAFTDYLNQVEAGSQAPPPIQELGKPSYSEEFPTTIEVPNNPPAATRLELGKYLLSLFESNGVQRDQIVNVPGMWSWLALLWFNSLCPTANDVRKVRDISKYVCSSDYTDYYRHFVAASWNIYSVYGEKSRLFLWTPLYIQNDFIEQLASRQDIITNGPLIEAFDRLYWDLGKNQPKTGAQGQKRPGNFRRLLQFVQQVELTYDIRAMAANEILGLLPTEYNSWKH